MKAPHHFKYCQTLILKPSFLMFFKNGKHSLKYLLYSRIAVCKLLKYSWSSSIQSSLNYQVASVLRFCFVSHKKHLFRRAIEKPWVEFMLNSRTWNDLLEILIQIEKWNIAVPINSRVYTYSRCFWVKKFPVSYCFSCALLSVVWRLCTL